MSRSKDDEMWAGREDRLDRWVDSGNDIEPDGVR